MASKFVDGNFSVQIRSRELVTSEIPLPESWLPLSNLDLAMPGVFPSCFFVYTNPQSQSEFQSMVSTLKEALSKLLVPFYPLAGVMVSNPVGEPELHCNHRGVEFVEAYADVKIGSLNLHDPEASLKGKLVLPALMEGVASLQVTELTCGSVVVSCTTDHRICDLYSINMFFEAWAEMARTGTISVSPTFRRSLLNPRRPGLSGKLTDHETCVVLPPSLPPSVPHVPSVGNYISRIYLMKAHDMEKIQAAASNHGARRSKLEALCGCLWKAVAKRASAGDTCKLGIAVDGRSSLIQEGGSRAAMGRYFGNVVSCPHGELDADELRKRPLSWVADRIHEFLETPKTKEFFLGLIDWLEASRPYPVLPKVFCGGNKDGLAFTVSHGRAFQVNKVDFGWGRPALGSVYLDGPLFCGCVQPVPSPSGAGDWVIYMSFCQHQLESVEAELGDVLHPLSIEHLY